jgi:calcineurin-like phosphoesterase
MPVRFEVATEDTRISSVLVSIDPGTGRAQSIRRIEVHHETHDDS